MKNTKEIIVTKETKSDEEQSQRDTGKRFKIGGAVLIAFLILYVPSLLHWVYGDNISTDMLRIGNIEESVSTEGVIIRDEEVLKPLSDGRLVPDISDGERVPANFRVATILKSNSSALLDELKEKNRKILEEQVKKADNKALFSDDVVKIDEMLDEKVGLLAELSNQNNLSKLSELKSEINELIEKRAEVLGSFSAGDKYIDTLKKERDLLKKQVDSGTESIIAKTPGIISYNVDGYEDMLNPEAVRSFTPEFLSKIKNVKPVDNPANMNVEAGKPLCKLEKGYYAYITVVLSENEARLFKEGEIISLRVNDVGNEIENCRILYISPKTEGKYIIEIRTDRDLSEMSGLRRVSVDLVKKSLDGLKIPLKSLFNIDYSKEQADVILVKYNCTTVRRVKIDMKNNEYAIVSPCDDKHENSINLNDIYVLNPKNVKEGQIIEQ